MPPRLLVLSYYTPPEPAVGGLRWAGLCRHLARRGWEVRIITASPALGKIDALPGVEVERVARRKTLEDRYRAWRAERGSGRPGDSAPAGPSGRSRGTGAGGDPSTRRGVLRQSLASLLGFPGHGRGWLLRAARTTRRTLRIWRPDVVVSTGPPHTVHLAASLGLGRSGVPWVIDLRDPWITADEGEVKVGWAPPVLRRLEITLMGRAHMVFTTTRELRDSVRARFPAASVCWVPNGVDAESLPSWSPDPDSGLTLTHLGTVYFNRDPTPVLRAFAGFLGDQPDGLRDRSLVRFVGHVSPEFRPALDHATRSLDLAGAVELRGTLPRPEALSVLARSRMALVLAQGQDGMVPAKLYEAVAMGIPTLVVTERDSSTGREAGRIGAIVHEPDDVPGMMATFARVWSGDKTSGDDTPPRVDHAYLAGEVERLLASFIEEKREGGRP